MLCNSTTGFVFCVYLTYSSPKDDIPAVFYRHYPAYVAGQLNVSELARVCGLSRPTVYKYMKLIR